MLAIIISKIVKNITINKIEKIFSLIKFYLSSLKFSKVINILF